MSTAGGGGATHVAPDGNSVITKTEKPQHSLPNLANRAGSRSAHQESDGEGVGVTFTTAAVRS